MKKTILNKPYVPGYESSTPNTARADANNSKKMILLWSQIVQRQILCRKKNINFHQI